MICQWSKCCITNMMLPWQHHNTYVIHTYYEFRAYAVLLPFDTYTRNRWTQWVVLWEPCFRHSQMTNCPQCSSSQQGIFWGGQLACYGLARSRLWTRLLPHFLDKRKISPGHLVPCEVYHHHIIVCNGSNMHAIFICRVKSIIILLVIIWREL